MTTNFAYDGPNVFADLDGSNALQTRYVRPNGVDALGARIVSGTVSWFNTDNQGSVRLITSAMGSVLDTINYDAWGNKTSENDPSAGSRYGYTGRESDSNLGLQYNRDRWYDAVTGRWTTQDPDGFDAGDSNLNRYVQNGPTNATDPTGLWDYKEVNKRLKEKYPDYYAFYIHNKDWAFVERPRYLVKGSGQYWKSEAGQRWFWFTDNMTPDEVADAFREKVATFFKEDFLKFREGLRKKEAAELAAIKDIAPIAKAYTDAFNNLKQGNEKVRKAAESLRKKGVVLWYVRGWGPFSNALSVKRPKGITHEYNFNKALDYIIARSTQLDELLGEATKTADRAVRDAKPGSIPGSVKELRTYGARAGNTLLALGTYYDLILFAQSLAHENSETAARGEVAILEKYILPFTNNAFHTLEKLKTGEADAEPHRDAFEKLVNGYCTFRHLFCHLDTNDLG